MQALVHRQHLSPGLSMARHRHVGAYAAVVLAGGYEEAGDAGRRKVRAGDVVLHGPFEAHLDRSGRLGARVLNVSLPGAILAGAFGHVADVDELVRLTERDPTAASDLIIRSIEPAASLASDWPDQLAADLTGDAVPRLEDWASAQSLTPEAVSRGFRRVFGVSPSRFRLEARARRAWAAARQTRADLAVIAADLGFADQAHMTRAVTGLTGRPPGTWRTMAA
jgi:AraC-like DNA-binding protein